MESRYDTETVAVERRIAAPPEIVFSYLTDPVRFTLWMGTKAELDPRPGGAYRIHVAPGQVATGTYQVIEPPTRLVFTWGWEGDAEVPPESSTVEMLLRAEAEGTVLQLRHTGLAEMASQVLHESGWTQFLDQLVTVAGAAV